MIRSLVSPSSPPFCSFSGISSPNSDLIDFLSSFWLQKSENELVQGIAFVSFAELIVRASTWDQMRREVLKDAVYGVFMNGVVKSLEERPIESNQEVLRALFVVLNANLKSRIPTDRLLRILLSIMSSSQKVPGKLGLQLYQDAAKCVPLVIDSGSTWAALLEHVIVAIHHILENLYHGFDDEKSLIRTLLPKVMDADGDGKKPFIIELWNLHSDSRVDITTTMHRVTILCHMIQFLLSSPLNFTVDVPVLELLVVVRHLIVLDGTRASPAHLHGLSMSDLLLAVPMLHQCAYLILETMVRQFRSRLFPFIVQIADLVVFEMSSTRNPIAAPCLAVPDVQSAVHRLVSVLLEVFQCGVIGIAQHALQHCLDDLQLDVSSGALAAPSASSKGDINAPSNASSSTSKQNPNKRKAAAKALSDPRAHINAEALTSAQSSLIGHKPDSLRISALLCLQIALDHLGSSINDELRASIDKTVVGLCITMTRHKNLPLWRRSQFEPAFSNPQVRIGIYQVLLASSISTGRLQTPVLPFANQFISVGQNDPDSRVASFCAHALDVLLTVIHPRVPLLPPSIAAEQRSSKLSTHSILSHQSELAMLHQHEERTLELLQRSQGRRAREGESEDMDDDRPTKKHMPAGFESSNVLHHNGASSSSSSAPTSSSTTSFLATLSQSAPDVQQRMDLSSSATSSEHTVLFKTTDAKKPSNTSTKPHPAEPMENPTASTSMAVDVDIVDDEPDSEDEM